MPTMNDKPTISTTLLGRLTANEQSAWREFVILWGPVIYELCRRKELHPSDAADVTQEVFFKIMQAIRAGMFQKRGRKGSSCKWIEVITLHEIATFWRKEGPRRKLFLDKSFSSGLLAESSVQSSDDRAAAERLELPTQILREAEDNVRNEADNKHWYCYDEYGKKNRRPAKAVGLEIGENAGYVRTNSHRVRKLIEDECRRRVDDTTRKIGSSD